MFAILPSARCPFRANSRARNGVNADISAMSAPATNTLPSALSTTTMTSSCAANQSIARSISSTSSVQSAFIGGRLNLSQPIPSDLLTEDT